MQNLSKLKLSVSFYFLSLKFDLDDAPNDKIDKSHIERIQTQEGHKNNVSFLVLCLKFQNSCFTDS